MLLDSFRRRFNILKNNNTNIKRALDIGAYRGDFTETIRAVWPSCIVTQIEADERQAKFLQPNAIFALLGDKEEENRNFYTLDENRITTGSSIFLEQTPYYTNDTTRVIKKDMTTLDIIMSQIKEPDTQEEVWHKHGLVKLDTQGSELLILSGAKNFLRIERPRFILLECSVMEYNRGAPLINTTIEYMYDIGFKITDIFDVNYDATGKLMQTDILFEALF